MKKLRLDLDQLSVESFGTERGGARRGTVEARSDTIGWNCGTYGTACWPYCGNNTDGDCGPTWEPVTGECCKPSMYNNDCTM